MKIKKHLRLRYFAAPVGEDVGATPPAGEPDAKPDPQDEPLGEPGKKALQAEREARSAAEKATKDLQARLDALEAEKLSDLEKAQLDAKKAAERAETAEREALRFKYAAKHGISDEDAALFLTGSTEEIVAQQAERFAARIEESAPKGPKAPPRDDERTPLKVEPGVGRLASAFDALDK